MRTPNTSIVAPAVASSHAPRYGGARSVGKSHKRKGVTLLEAIGFLTVATIIIASSLGIYEQAQLQLRTHRTITAVAIMHTFVRGIYANTIQFGTALDEEMQNIIVDANGVSHGMLIEPLGGGRYELRSAFGGEVLLRVGNRTNATTTAGEKINFFISAEGLPTDVCINIATQSVGAAFYGLKSFLINDVVFLRGSGGVDPPAYTGPPHYPVPPNRASTECSKQSVNNVLTWNYQ